MAQYGVSDLGSHLLLRYVIKSKGPESLWKLSNGDQVGNICRELNSAYRLGQDDAREGMNAYRSFDVRNTNEKGSHYGVLVDGIGYVLMTLTQTMARACAARLSVAYQEGRDNV